MPAGRAGVGAKFVRARQLLNELELSVAAFLALQPFALEERDEQETGDLVYRVRVERQPPIEWSTVVGDIVHNARSALDHLAWRLVEAGGGTPSDATYFPIADAEAGYGEKVRKALKGASQANREAVKALRPWRGGDNDLWRLHRLDIVDKHRLLVPVGAAQRGIVLGGTFAGFDERLQPVRLPPIELRAADNQYPLQDGAEVFRVMKAARTADPAGFAFEHRVSFGIAFGDGLIVEGEPLVPVLRGLVENAASVAEPLMASIQ